MRACTGPGACAVTGAGTHAHACTGQVLVQVQALADAQLWAKYHVQVQVQVHAQALAQPHGQAHLWGQAQWQVQAYVQANVHVLEQVQA